MCERFIVDVVFIHESYEHGEVVVLQGFNILS
jgi:hypothetical protein